MEQVPKIVQQRLRNTARPEVHLDADLLTAFAENLLGERDRTEVLGHLAECAVCRETVALANATKNEAPEVSPVPAARSRWLTWPVLRWGTLAACVVVVGTAVTLHYQLRTEVKPRIATEISAPAATLPTVMLDSQDAGQPREKLAAKIPPPLPYQAGRDLAMVGKLAKQPGTTNGRTADHLEIDRIQASRTGVNAPAGDQAARNELANSISVVSGSEAPTTLRQQAAAAAVSPTPAPVPSPAPAPAPVSPPAAKTAGAELEARQRDDLNKVGRITETVTVEAEPAQIATESVSPKSVDESLKDEEAKKAQKTPAGIVGLGGRKADMTRAETVSVQSKKSKKHSRARTNAAPGWTLSPEGGLQRSFDSGRTWQTVPVASGVVFRALAANDSDIWAGGAAGALYHSSDAGQRWTEIKPVADGKQLTANIMHVEFADPQHGKLTTDNHETWITSDGGQTWRVE
jgi:hypothetical protein